MVFCAQSGLAYSGAQKYFITWKNILTFWKIGTLKNCKKSIPKSISMKKNSLKKYIFWPTSGPGRAGGGTPWAQGGPHTTRHEKMTRKLDEKTFTKSFLFVFLCFSLEHPLQKTFCKVKMPLLQMSSGSTKIQITNHWTIGIINKYLFYLNNAFSLVIN